MTRDTSIEAPAPKRVLGNASIAPWQASWMQLTPSRTPGRVDRDTYSRVREVEGALPERPSGSAEETPPLLSSPISHVPSYNALHLRTLTAMGLF